MATGRFQVRENGIWGYWSLILWDKIGFYHWADDSTLVIRPKSTVRLTAALPAPPEQRQAVDELLANRRPPH